MACAIEETHTQLLKSEVDSAGVSSPSSRVREEGWKYSRAYEPYSRAVMALIEEVEQRVRSPQHLCGRLMTTEPQERKTDTKKGSLKQALAYWTDAEVRAV